MSRARSLRSRGALALAAGGVARAGGLGASRRRGRLATLARRARLAFARRGGMACFVGLVGIHRVIVPSCHRGCDRVSRRLDGSRSNHHDRTRHLRRGDPPRDDGQSVGGHCRGEHPARRGAHPTGACGHAADDLGRSLQRHARQRPRSGRRRRHAAEHVLGLDSGVDAALCAGAMGAPRSSGRPAPGGPGNGRRHPAADRPWRRRSRT